MRRRIVETYHKTATSVWIKVTDPDAQEYETDRALRLFEALGADIMDESFVLARHVHDPDTWAVIGPDGQIAYEAGEEPEGS